MSWAKHQFRLALYPLLVGPITAHQAFQQITLFINPQSLVTDGRRASTAEDSRSSQSTPNTRGKRTVSWIGLDAETEDLFESTECKRSSKEGPGHAILLIGIHSHGLHSRIEPTNRRYTARPHWSFDRETRLINVKRKIQCTVLKLCVHTFLVAACFVYFGSDND